MVFAEVEDDRGVGAEAAGDFSWKLDSSATMSDGGGASRQRSSASSMGSPKLPIASAWTPPRRARWAAKAVTVLLPLVPVTASRRVSAAPCRRQWLSKRATSLVRRLRGNGSCDGATPGLTATAS